MIAGLCNAAECTHKQGLVPNSKRGDPGLDLKPARVEGKASDWSLLRSVSNLDVTLAGCSRETCVSCHMHSRAGDLCACACDKLPGISYTPLFLKVLSCF